MFPPVMTCHGWELSSQTTVCFGVVKEPPPESVSFHCHQTVDPGGREPDWRISQVHWTFTSVLAVTVGKASAWTVPQVSWLTPYSSTAEDISVPDLNSAENRMVSGKFKVAWSLTTCTFAWAWTGTDRLTINIRSRRMAGRRTFMDSFLSMTD